MREAMGRGIGLQFYVPEGARHHGKLLYEWLLEAAKQQGLKGGSAFRAIAGFGRHGEMHYDTFFELAGKLPVEVRFMTTPELANSFLAFLEREKLDLFYVRSEVQYGWIRDG
jgi:PII-like signaling protein